MDNIGGLIYISLIIVNFLIHLYNQVYFIFAVVDHLYKVVGYKNLNHLSERSEKYNVMFQGYNICKIYLLRIFRRCNRSKVDGESLYRIYHKVKNKIKKDLDIAGIIENKNEFVID